MLNTKLTTIKTTNTQVTNSFSANSLGNGFTNQRLTNKGLDLVQQASYTAANQDNFSLISPLFSRLANLSKQAKWILFTEEVPLPTKEELSEFRIEQHKVIKTRASKTLSNKELLIKMIDAKTASAIVTSQSFTESEMSLLQNKALENGCEIFFINEQEQSLFSRSLH